MRLLPLLIALSVATPAMAQRADKPDAAASGAASTQPAQPPITVIAEPVALMIAAFDRDGDARVTRAEFDAGLRHSFDSMNPRDGALGYIAFSDWAERWMGDRNTLPSPFETDADGDNRITFDELSARFDAIFTRFDKDKDGVLTRKELLTIRPQAQNVNFGNQRRRR